MKRYGESNFSILFNRRAPFWDYQVNHMYLRYFGWNFLGRFGVNVFTIIPFFIGCVGFIYSLIKKIKIWLFVFINFLFFSLGLVIYANIREGFDFIREIDRLFIPSFFIFLIWIGIGLYFLTFLIENLLEKVKLKSKVSFALISILALLILPINLMINNWYTCNKNGYYFPEDFARNMLSSCKQNAVLFVNGDNDTFPLWYEQSVEGFRPDVSVVNVYLLNAEYFLKQLQRQKNKFVFDPQILKLKEFRPSVIKDSIEIKIPIKNSLQQKENEDTLITYYTGRTFGKKRGMLVQDKVMISFLKENDWKQPVYFSVTVYSGNMVGMQDYLQTIGLVRQLIPFMGNSFNEKEVERNLLDVYKYRNFNNRNIFLGRNTISIYSNYRYLFLSLINRYLEQGKRDKAKFIFEKMQNYLPEWRFTKAQNQPVEDIKKKLYD